jgi:hypothetical protein
MQAIAAVSWTWRWPTWPEVALGFVLFVGTAVLSVAFTGWILIRMPANYFVGPKAPPLWDHRHPVLHALGHIAKNVIGVVLVVTGLVFLFTPGQGVLTLLIGLMLLEFPGKRKFERKLVRRPQVLKVVNALRRRYGRPDLDFDDDEQPREE